MKEYIRFGDIPENERSGIYRGDEGKIGEEIGVSCYEFIFLDGRYRILLPLNANIHVCATLGHLIDEYLGGSRKVFLVTGEEVEVEGYQEQCQFILTEFLKGDCSWSCLCNETQCYDYDETGYPIASVFPLVCYLKDKGII